MAHRMHRRKTETHGLDGGGCNAVYRRPAPAYELSDDVRQLQRDRRVHARQRAPDDESWHERRLCLLEWTRHYQQVRP